MTKSPSHWLAALIAVASLAPSYVRSQDRHTLPNAEPAAVRDSLPFRAGQWGAEFAIDDGTVGLGVLRFRSPRRAWLLDAAFNAGWSDEESSFGSGNRTNVFVRVRTGPRAYRPIHAASAGYVGIGLTGAYSWAGSENEYRRLWDAGLFGELGALYFVTPHLSLGAQIGLSARYTESRQRLSGPGLPIDWDRLVSVGVGSVRIVGALYF
jgi:hypothetical protein